MPRREGSQNRAPDETVRMAGRAGTAALAVGLAAAFAGCLGGGHSRPTCPGGPGSCLTLASLWPSDDGTAWNYSYAERIWTIPAEIYSDPGSVPPAPPLDEAYAALGRALAEHPDSSVDAVYRLQFQGRITTRSGAEGQHLVTQFVLRDPAKRRPPMPDGDPLLSRLAEVRPDLRARIASLTGTSVGAQRPSTTPLETWFAPFFLQGYCWARLEDRIGGYGDLSRRLSWIYLMADLEPGSTFRHPLVPELADDVFLHGRITRRLDAVTAAGTFRNCLECFYLVDFGPTRLTDESGHPYGYSRTVDVGTIAYAPGVGPVQSSEYREWPLPVELGFGFAAVIRLDLVGRSVP